jgi:hypothetical protein
VEFELMKKNILIFAVIVSIFITFFAEASKEGKPHDNTGKTPLTRNVTHRYVVQKNDVISAIIRRLPGITDADIGEYYRVIRELNPQMENMQNIFPGQVIVLPGKEGAVKEEVKSSKKAETKASVAEASKEGTPPVNLPKTSLTRNVTHKYVVQKGDVLSSIIRKQPDFTEASIGEYYRIIKELNPQMENKQKLIAGHVIVLPGKGLADKERGKSSGDKSVVQKRETQSYVIQRDDTFKGEPVTVKKVEIKTGERKMAVKEKEVMSVRETLAVVKRIVTEMGASFTDSGNQYLADTGSEQIKIDCTKVPVIKFINDMTVFLDLDGIANDDLKKVIHDNRENYHLVTVVKNDNYIIILKKIFSANGVYSIAKNDKTISVGKNPDIGLMVDWIICQKDEENKLRRIQGLRIVGQSNNCLPNAIINYARKSGFVITEILPGKGITGYPGKTYSLPAIPAFSISSVKDFSYDLITTLGFKAVKNENIKVFDIIKHGFNFSISTDIMVKKGGKNYIVFCHAINPQYISALEADGNVVINLSDEDSPDTAMEKVLRSFGFVFASGYFRFSGAERGQAPFHLGFNGAKIKTDKELYVINFEMEPDLHGMLHELWATQFVRY